MTIQPPIPVSDSNGPHRVVVAGASYGGVSLVLNLLAQIDNTTFGPGAAPNPKQTGTLKRDVHITIIDERDGFCRCSLFLRFIIIFYFLFIFFLQCFVGCSLLNAE